MVERKIDLLTQVAEAKCGYSELILVDGPVDGGIEAICINGKMSLNGQGHLPHEDCQGTGLRWPTLSRVCLWKSADGETPICPDHVDGHRVPYLSLEKALAEARNIGRVVLYSAESVGGTPIEWHVSIHYVPNHADFRSGDGSTPLEAACAALLTTRKEE